jgi:hypothetical protein
MNGNRHWHPKILGFWVWYLGFPPKPKPKNPKNPKFNPNPNPEYQKIRSKNPKTQYFLGLKISKIKFYS